MQPDVFERDQVLAGGHAGSTVTDDVIDRSLSQRLAKILSECIGRSKRTAFVDISHKVMVRGAGNVTRDTVDGFDLTPVALGSSSVEQQPVLASHQPCDLIDIRDHVGSW